MADLEEIIAAAGISIVEDGGDCPALTHTGPGNLPTLSVMGDGQCGNPEEFAAVKELEEMFHARYTDADPDYVSCVQQKSMPPCVQDFWCRRQRDENRGRRRGGRGGYDNQGSRGGGRDWGSRDRSQGYGDYHHNRSQDRGYNNYSREGGRGYGHNNYDREGGRGYGDNNYRREGERGYGHNNYSREGSRGYGQNNSEGGRGYGQNNREGERGYGDRSHRDRSL